MAAFFETLYERTGWNFPIFYNLWDGTKFIRGLGLTIELALLGIAGALLVGGACLLLRECRVRPAAWAVAAYVEFFRNTPGLAQLYFLFFGIGSWLQLSTPGPGGTPPVLSPLTFVVISIAVHHGAFVAEVLRANLEAVPRGIVESAAALGYGHWQSLRRVTLPLALRTSLPAMGNIAAQIVKGTALAYAIAVPETLYVSHEIWSERFNVVEMMNVVLVTYLSLMAIFSAVVRGLEVWLRVPGYGR
ncbi:amino acid ABC transporter permease [Azospirillum endophyticum]